jgi:DNA-binding response OmpR family regulator
MTNNSLLIVEDQFLLADLLESMFAEAGFQVVIAIDGVQAIAELHADATRFRAIITDIRLGSGPDGWDVAWYAREVVPNMPIVYMSGDSAHDWPIKGVPNSVFVPKPFTQSQISSAVASLLNRADSCPSYLSSCVGRPGLEMTVEVGREARGLSRLCG